MLKKSSKQKEPIRPEPREKAYFANTKIYKFFCGHVVKEVAQQLPSDPVVCWHDQSALSLPECAVNKFMKEVSYCKRCPLFQEGYTHVNSLIALIEDWEKDDLEE